MYLIISTLDNIFQSVLKELLLVCDILHIGMDDKIERKFVHKEAYHIIRGWILDGTLLPGVQIHDKELAERLGVSRTPIREALLHLEDEGLVITKPNRSTQVTFLNEESAYHLYSLVWTLEGLALSQAFESISDTHIQEMMEANERFLKTIKAHERLAALEADNDFHFVFIKLSQNQELEKILSEVKQKLRRLDLYYFDKIQDIIHPYEEHLQLIDALKQRDLSKAQKALENNWRRSYSRFQV